MSDGDIDIVFNNRMKEPLVRSSFRYRQEDPEYHGESLDEKYSEGPESKRGCTDILCCLLFLVFLAAMGYVAILAFSQGNPEYLVYPFDSNSNQCGFTSGYEDYPYVYIGQYNLKVIYVCTKSCPAADNTPLECSPSQTNPTCDLITNTYGTLTVFTYCLPLNQVTVGTQLVKDILNIGVLQQYFSDVYESWQLILAMVGVSLVVSIIYSVLIRYFAGCMVWTMIILLLTLLLVIGVSTALLSQNVQFIMNLINYDSLPNSFKDKTYETVVACITLTTFAIGFLIVCCMRKEIKISIGVIKAAADFVRNCCGAFLIPFYITIFQLLFLSFWIVVILFLFSSNDGKIVPEAGTPFAAVTWNEETQKLIIFYIFGLLWIVNFFSGLECFWVSSTAAIWYFEEGKPSTPVLKSICRSFYHLGSIAFGSLLIALITFVRIILEYINNQLKSKTMGMNDGRAVNLMIKCASCLVACFQRIVRFITQNAYIMMAITGKNFCASAAESFYLMVRSAAQFFISHGTTKLFINIGTCLIVTISCFSGYLFVTNIQPYRSLIQSPVFLTIVFAIVSLPIAWAFMEFFQKGANTILMCYCVELDTVKANKKCPPGLKNFLDQYAQVSASRL